MNNYLKLAKPFYSNNKDHFHTYHHATIVNENGKKILENLGITELELYKAINLSTAFHDAGYHHSEASQFESKEDYSIHILRKIAKEHNISEKIVKVAIEGIEGTKIHQINFNPQASKILRAADISNLGDSYENMLQDTIKIYKEYSDLNKKVLLEKNIYPLHRNIFKEKQAEILKDILIKSKEGIPENYFLHKNFYQKMKENINKLSQQESPL